MQPRQVRIFEVGVRDGLQNECKILSRKEKIGLIESLVKVGVRDIEVGAFVRPDRVPQMADTEQIYTAIHQGHLNLGKARPWALVPNRIGLERALSVGVTRIAVFTAATESFAKKNIGMSITDSIAEFKQVIREGRAVLGKKLKVRSYVSTAFGCPFEGRVTPKKALKVIEKLAELDVDEISVGDTIGVATPRDVDQLIKPALDLIGNEKLAVHFHDTCGTALANAFRSLELGIKIMDSSAGGLGGCPFAPGASGNLATEDLVYLLNGMGIKTGIDLRALCEVSLKLAKKMGKPLASRYLQYYSSQKKLGLLS